MFETSRKAGAGHGVLAALFVYQAAYSIAYTPCRLSVCAWMRWLIWGSVGILYGGDFAVFLAGKGAGDDVSVCDCCADIQPIRGLFLVVSDWLLTRMQTNPIALEALKWKYCKLPGPVASIGLIKG